MTEGERKEKEGGTSPSSSFLSNAPVWLVLIIGVLAVVTALVFIFNTVTGGVDNSPDIPRVEL